MGSISKSPSYAERLLVTVGSLYNTTIKTYLALLLKFFSHKRYASWPHFSDKVMVFGHLSITPLCKTKRWWMKAAENSTYSSSLNCVTLMRV